MNFKKYIFFQLILILNISTISAFFSDFTHDIKNAIREIESEIERTEHYFGNAAHENDSKISISFDSENETIKINLPLKIVSADIKTYRDANMCRIIVQKDLFNIEISISNNKYKITSRNEKKEEKADGTSLISSRSSFAQQQSLPYMVDLSEVVVGIDSKNNILEVVTPRIHGTSRDQHVPVYEK